MRPARIALLFGAGFTAGEGSAYDNWKLYAIAALILGFLYFSQETNQTKETK